MTLSSMHSQRYDHNISYGIGCRTTTNMTLISIDVMYPPRRVRHALLDKVKQELDSMVDLVVQY